MTHSTNAHELLDRDEQRVDHNAQARQRVRELEHPEEAQQPQHREP